MLCIGWWSFPVNITFKLNAFTWEAKRRNYSPAGLEKYACFPCELSLFFLPHWNHFLFYAYRSLNYAWILWKSNRLTVLAIHYIYIYLFIVSMCVPWELNPLPFALYHWATGTAMFICRLLLFLFVEGKEFFNCYWLSLQHFLFSCSSIEAWSVPGFQHFPPSLLKRTEGATLPVYK